MGREPRRRGGYDHAAAEELVAELGRRHGLRVDPRAPVGDAVGRRPAARRDPARAAPRRRRADPRRADGGADPAGDRGPVPRPRASWRPPGAPCCSSPTSCARCSRCPTRSPCCAAARSRARAPASETDAAELTRLMVGRAVDLRRVEPAQPPGAPALEVRGLDGPGPARRRRSRCARARSSASPASTATARPSWPRRSRACARRTTGTVRIGGADLTGASVAERRAAGLGYIPDDRYARGLARAASISDNLLMGRHHGRLAPRGLLDRRAIADARAAARRALRRAHRLRRRRRRDAVGRQRAEARDRARAGGRPARS